MKLTRRSVLRAIASVSVANSTIALASSGKKHRVIIVGAGPSGLAAAYELSTVGHEALVFEARSRTGGRMHTLRDEFDDGLYAEAGAAILTAGNPGLDYAKEFGLELDPISFDPDKGSVAHIRGVRVSELPGEVPRYPVALDGEDASLTIQQLKTKYYRLPARQLEGLSRLRDDDYPQEDFLHLDKMPLIDYLRSNGASDEAIELMRLGYFEAYGEGIETASTLQLLREMASFGPGVFRIQGGNDQICAKLAGRLPEPVQHDSPVIAIEQSEAGVRVVVENSGGQHEVMGDYVVVTAPLQVQSKIAFTPALSDLRNAAIREIGGGDATRVYLQTKTRYWEKNGYSGTATTDLPVGSVFHSTASQDGTRGILESFTYEARARHMGSLTKAEQWHEMINGISKVYPGIEEQAEKMTSYDWGKDPWARGGHVAFSVGQIGRFQKALKEPEGRIYFAGDAIGGVSGYSHAAFQSGIDVAAEIERL